MSNASYTFKLNTAKIRQVEDNAVLGLIKMAYDINNRAKSKAPIKTGALVNSIRVNDAGTHSKTIYVLAGGTAGGYNVPYARIREFENNLHPSTTHYIGNAFQEIAKNYSKYFKGITK